MGYMDRRYFLFILCVVATFFGLNWYQSNDREEKARLLRQEATANKPPVQEETLPQNTFTPPSTANTKEVFYVLENEYQQLVISNFGGALAEINLAFQSADDPESLVREIDIDRKLLEESPGNERFPMYPYQIAGKGLQEPQEGGFYPLLRRPLISDRGVAISTVAPKFYALNIVSDYPEVANLVYSVKKFEKDQIVLEAVQPHRRITKTFTLSQDPKAPYTFDLSLQVDGDARGLWLTTGIPEVEVMSGSASPSIQYRNTYRGDVKVQRVDLPKAGEFSTNSSISPDWVCNSNGYLGLILDPLGASGISGFKVEGIAGVALPTRLAEVDRNLDRFQAKDYPGYDILLPLPVQNGVQNFRVFAGPFAESLLTSIDTHYSDPATGYNPDYIACKTYHGWFSFISQPFAKMLMVLMNMFHNMTGSWALSIVLLTVVVRILLYPLNAWSMKSTRRMQKLSPEVAAIQAKYKKDPKKAQQMVMALYKEKKVNPFMGCFPLLIQMPFLIGMFDLLKSSFELRGVPFIPGWIDNLTAPDVVFSWGFSIPLIGSQLHLLPILLGAAMWLTQKMSSTLPKDKSLWTEQQKSQRTMGNLMTVFFTVMFYNFASGLNIYWLSSMLLGLVQQWITNKMLDKTEGQRPHTVVLPAKKG